MGKRLYSVYTHTAGKVRSDKNVLCEGNKDVLPSWTALAINFYIKSYLREHISTGSCFPCNHYAASAGFIHSCISLNVVLVILLS